MRFAVVEKGVGDGGRALDVHGVGAAAEDDHLGVQVRDAFLWGARREGGRMVSGGGGDSISARAREHKKDLKKRSIGSIGSVDR